MSSVVSENNDIVRDQNVFFVEKYLNFCILETRATKVDKILVSGSEIVQWSVNKNHWRRLHVSTIDNGQFPTHKLIFYKL